MSLSAFNTAFGIDSQKQQLLQGHQAPRFVNEPWHGEPTAFVRLCSSLVRQTHLGHIRDRETSDSLFCAFLACLRSTQVYIHAIATTALRCPTISGSLRLQI